jgi:hypothetical protein
MQSDEGLSAGSVLNLATSIGTTALIAMYVRRRWPVWRRRRFERDDQLVAVALALIGANAAMSFGYTKDDIMSAAGMFYPLAAYVAARDVVLRRPSVSNRGTIVVAMLLAALAGGWALRSAGVHYHMRVMAFSVRNDWVGVDRWLESQRAMPSTAEGRQLVSELREDALRRPVINPFFFPYWMSRWIR